MSKEWDVLAASANLEHRRSLIRILKELPPQCDLCFYLPASRRGALPSTHRARVLRSAVARRLLPGIAEPRALRSADAARGVDYRSERFAGSRELAECGVLGTVRYPFHATEGALQAIRATHEERTEEVPAAITH